MLVLSRKIGQSVRIGEGVRLTVLDLGHGQVRLGIEAEGDVRVYREEIFERIAAANREAASPDAGLDPTGTLGAEGPAELVSGTAHPLRSRSRSRNE